MDMVDLASVWKGGAGTAPSEGRRTGVAGIDIGPDRAPSPGGVTSAASFPGNRQRLAMRTPPAAPIQASTACSAHQSASQPRLQEHAVAVEGQIGALSLRKAAHVALQRVLQP